MGRGLPPGQKACARKDVAGNFNRAQPDAETRLAAQPCQQGRVTVIFRPPTARHEHDVIARELARQAHASDLHPVAGCDLAGLCRMKAMGVKRGVRQIVGDARGLEQADHAHHVEPW